MKTQLIIICVGAFSIAAQAQDSLVLQSSNHKPEWSTHTVISDKDIGGLLQLRKKIDDDTLIEGSVGLISNRGQADVLGGLGARTTFSSPDAQRTRVEIGLKAEQWKNMGTLGFDIGARFLQSDGKSYSSFLFVPLGGFNDRKNSMQSMMIGPKTMTHQSFANDQLIIEAAVAIGALLGGHSNQLPVGNDNYVSRSSDQIGIGYYAQGNLSAKYNINLGVGQNTFVKAEAVWQGSGARLGLQYTLPGEQEVRWINNSSTTFLISVGGTF